MDSFLLQSQLPPAGSSAAPAAAASPQWMLLAPYGEACNITGDSKTIASAATSEGHRIGVSLHREPFSALSRICLCYLPGRTTWPWATSTVIAAHGGSVLMRITWRISSSVDCFVYDVGDAAADPARPPSLYLLPARWRLDICATGLLSYGEAEFVVADLTIVGSKYHVAAAARQARLIAFELRLFCHGEWCVKQPWFVYGNGMERKEIWAQWETIAVVPLGNGLLCWVDWYSGVIFTNVLDEGPSKLRYVPYPTEAVMYQRFVCTNIRGELKLVSISRHRCSNCGCCEHATNKDICSEHATDIDIWTLNTDDMAWVLETKTNMVDSTELWMIPNIPGYARTHLVYPVTSMNGGGHVVASINIGGGDVPDDSVAPMEEEDGHMSLSIGTLSSTASLHDGSHGGSRETSASTGDQQQCNNEPCTEDRWPKRRRRAISMETGPDCITK